MRRRTPILVVTAAAAGCIPSMSAMPMMGVSPESLPAPAPVIPPEVDPVFCTTEGADLLRDLAGAWHFEGDERTVWMATPQGSMTMRVDPEDDEEFDLEYLADSGLMHATSPTSEDEMYFFPATDEQRPAAETMLGGATPRPGCDWTDSPVIIGTNFYYGSEGLHLEDWGRWRPGCEALAMAGEPVDPTMCHTRPAPEDVDFRMEMTLVLRFAGRNYASGVVYFRGEQRDADFADDDSAVISEFRARAAVELTRR